MQQQQQQQQQKQNMFNNGMDDGFQPITRSATGGSPNGFSGQNSKFFY